MTPDFAGIQDGRTPGRAAPRWGGGDAPRGTVGWYRDASGGFIPGTPDTWNPQVAFLVFPRITSSPRIERRAMSRFAARSHHISTLPVADQVRELRTALSVNKSELARGRERGSVLLPKCGERPRAGGRRISPRFMLSWIASVTGRHSHRGAVIPGSARSRGGNGDRSAGDTLTITSGSSVCRADGGRGAVSSASTAGRGGGRYLSQIRLAHRTSRKVAAARGLGSVVGGMVDSCRRAV